MHRFWDCGTTKGRVLARHTACHHGVITGNNSCSDWIAFNVSYIDCGPTECSVDVFEDGRGVDCPPCVGYTAFLKSFQQAAPVAQQGMCSSHVFLVHCWH